LTIKLFIPACILSLSQGVDQKKGMKMMNRNNANANSSGAVVLAWIGV
jgi:hypothetical protein